MRKKEEFESSRLLDFEFRQRARATRLLARWVGCDEAALVRDIASFGEQELIEKVAAGSGRSLSEVAAEYSRCRTLARQQLIEERGDPTPYRLG